MILELVCSVDHGSMGHYETDAPLDVIEDVIEVVRQNQVLQGDGGEVGKLIGMLEVLGYTTTASPSVKILI